MVAKLSRVVIIGAGAVGSTTAYSLLVEALVDEIVIIDLNKAKANGEAMDLEHSLEFQKRNTTIYSGEYSDCLDADIVVITASAPFDGVYDRLLQQSKSEKIVSSIVTNVMNSGFDGIFIVVSNPVDVMSYLVWKKSGLPYKRVIGTGTILETARLKNIIGNTLQMDPKSIDACALGEHGNSMMVPWSHVRAAGKNIKAIITDNYDKYKDIDLANILQLTKEAGTNVLKLKGNTQYGIASAVVHIIKAIMYNENKLIPVSTYINGEYNTFDAYAGVPAIINRNGIREIGEFHLEKDEIEAFNDSIKIIKNAISQLKSV